ncbi:Hypothetical predicted protein [Mytilus galloprovincialis]|uniref:Uncharacterized protein n=1 Tax=Mytilus galloprovincialis TaxID=29158 RepID=A0A8B6G1L8_MYTGA|nr:Hypothetical predicted protein [Mytilus galloprovincialis]
MSSEDSDSEDSVFVTRPLCTDIRVWTRTSGCIPKDDDHYEHRIGAEAIVGLRRDAIPKSLDASYPPKVDVTSHLKSVRYTLQNGREF